MPRKTIPAIYRRVSILGDRTFLVAVIEAVIVFSGICGAFALHDGKLPPVHVLLSMAIVIVPIRLGALYCCGLVRGWWRYTGLREVLRLMYATGLGTGMVVVLIVIGVVVTSKEWSFYFLEAIMSVLLLGLARMVPRFMFDVVLPKNAPAKRLIILGAGSGAVLILGELEQSDATSVAVACLDDNPTKVGIRIRGVPVEGGCGLLPELVKKYRADEVWIAIPSASQSQMSRLVDICVKAGVPYRTLPCVRDVVSGRLVQQLHEVDLDDLLGRDPIKSDLATVRHRLQDRVIMVTGAAGSIGSELCKQLLKYGPAQLICLDQSETGMFYLELDLKKSAGNCSVRYYVADICNGDHFQRVIRQHGVQVIFHAAAYKHVPVMENNVEEALRNNVFSLLRMLDIAEQAQVRSFVMISSDKAVNPTNVMGTTKRIGELILASRPFGMMSCVSVRFGNVLGSNGSVVPILQEQIRLNSTVTITHPEIKRYFMTISEAVSLVLQAYAIGCHGDLLVLDMGEPVLIVDLARQLIRLSGKTEREVPIHFIGLREGEKLKEELFYPSEQVSHTERKKVLRTRSDLESWARLKEMLDELYEVNGCGNIDIVKTKMKEIVPQYDYVSRAEDGGERKPFTKAAVVGRYGEARTPSSETAVSAPN